MLVTGAGGVIGSIVVYKSKDPGSSPGQRSFFNIFFFFATIHILYSIQHLTNEQVSTYNKNQ